MVQKTVEELNLDKALHGTDGIFSVNALTVGLNYDVFTLGQSHLAVGAQMSGYQAPASLNK